MAIKPLTLINGTVADANDVEAIFAPLYADIAPLNVQPVNKLGTGRFVLESALTQATLPVGCIIAFYDFNGAVTFDPTIWAYCDGSVLNSPGSPIDGQTLPDLSNRYMVGFGTEGGGDIGTALWQVPPVGNANHQVNLQHSHTVNAHNHSLGSHSHTAVDHAHNMTGLGQGTNFIDTNVGAANEFQLNIGGNDIICSTVPGGSGNHTHDYLGPSDFAAVTINNTNLGNSGNSSPGTNNGLSTTEDVQPRSIRVRFIMRIN